MSSELGFYYGWAGRWTRLKGRDLRRSQALAKLQAFDHRAADLPSGSEAPIWPHLVATGHQMWPDW